MFRLCITGSREWTPDLQPIVRKAVTALLQAAVKAGDTRIVVGDARKGVDLWTIGGCAMLGHMPEIHGGFEKINPEFRNIKAYKLTHSGDYLRRDEHMILGKPAFVVWPKDKALRPAQMGAPVHMCTAFEFLGSPTHGTRHTYQVAQQAGLQVVVYQWAAGQVKPRVLMYAGTTLIEEDGVKVPGAQGDSVAVPVTV